jgi:nitrogen-specific signal transduction histidine kinase
MLETTVMRMAGLIDNVLDFARGRLGGGIMLGLGLHIASQIAKAHDGALTVTSTPAETCFFFAMPLR